MKSSKTVTELWMELQMLLNEKYEGYTQLQKEAATMEEIRQVEKKINQRLPDPLKELYLCNNGEDERAASLLGFSLSPLEELYAQWQVWDELRDQWNEEEGGCTSYPEGHIKTVYINSLWIPFTHDGGGNHIGMDLDPDEKGTYGQIINFGGDEDDKFVIAPSLNDFLQLIIHLYQEHELTIVEEEEGWLIPRLGEEEIHHGIDFLRERILPVRG